MKRPYLILTGLLAFFLVYLLVNYVAERYSDTFALYSNLRKKSESVVDPAALPTERARLLAERDSLSRQILASRSKYRQSEIGVIQCVTDNARQHHVLVKSFSPGSAVTRGQFMYFNFSLSLRAPFYRTGELINNLENSAIPFEINEVRIVSNPIGEPVLTTNLQAIATLYHGFGKKER